MLHLDVPPQVMLVDDVMQVGEDLGGRGVADASSFSARELTRGTHNRVQRGLGAQEKL